MYAQVFIIQIVVSDGYSSTSSFQFGCMLIHHVNKACYSLDFTTRELQKWLNICKIKHSLESLINILSVQLIHPLFASPIRFWVHIDFYGFIYYVVFLFQESTTLSDAYWNLANLPNSTAMMKAKIRKHNNLLIFVTLRRRRIVVLHPQKSINRRLNKYVFNTKTLLVLANNNCYLCSDGWKDQILYGKAHEILAS